MFRGCALVVVEMEGEATGPGGRVAGNRGSPAVLRG